MMPQPMLAGQVRDFLLRLSGRRRPEEVYRARGIRGEIRLVSVRLIIVIMLANLYQQAVIHLTVMACMIWQGMFGNGVLIGMALIIIANHPHVILKDRVRAVPVFCGAVLGTTLQSACVQLAATSSIQRVPTMTASVFVVCQDFRTVGPFTFFRAQHGLNCFTTSGFQGGQQRFLGWLVVFKIECLIHTDLSRSKNPSISRSCCT